MQQAATHCWNGNDRAAPVVDPYATRVPLALNSQRRTGRVALGREDKVAFRQSVDFVRPDLHLRSPPGEEDVRMVALLFGDGANAVHEVQGLHEVLEPVLLLEVVVVDHAPTLELREQRLDLLWSERRNATF